MHYHATDDERNECLACVGESLGNMNVLAGNLTFENTTLRAKLERYRAFVAGLQTGYKTSSEYHICEGCKQYPCAPNCIVKEAQGDA